MGKTHKKTDRRQGSIKRARHRDRRMKIGAIVLCAAIVITTFLAVWHAAFGSCSRRGGRC